MLLYFSATGNNEYIANQLATATGDTAVSLTAVSDRVSLADGEALGLVVPTYFWGLPSIVDEFLRSVAIDNADNAYIYLVATYGTTCGQIEHFVAQHLKKKGLRLSAAFGIKTVDNWTVWFSVKDAAANARTLAEEGRQLAAVTAAVKARQVATVTRDKKSLFMCKNARFFYEKARRTSHLHVTDACVGCGACARDCPVGAIRLADGVPTWVAKRCAMCLRCLHRCPTFAIQYDNKTQENGQYVHP